MTSLEMTILLVDKKISMRSLSKIIKNKQVILNNLKNSYGRELLIGSSNNLKRQMKQKLQVKMISFLINSRNRIRSMRYNTSPMRNLKDLMINKLRKVTIDLSLIIPILHQCHI